LGSLWGGHVTTKVRAAMLVSLAIVWIAGVAITHARASGDKAEVMVLSQRLIAAYNSKDVSANMARYSDDPDAIFLRGHHPA